MYYVNVSEECSILVLTDCGFYYIKPKNGLLTVLPSWIKHFVPKQESSHERIIVSGNISTKKYLRIHLTIVPFINIVYTEMEKLNYVNIQRILIRR